jgi:putative intracellular protease/amidase
MRIDIPVFDGFDELDAIGPFEVFQNAAAGGGDFSTRLVTREPADVITGSHGVPVVPHGVIAAGATVVRDRVVDDGDLLTAGGVTSGIDLALWIVERFGAVSLADRVADQMEYTRTRPLTAPAR